MKHLALREMTVAQLVELFVAIALRQDEVMLEPAKYNRLYGEMDAIKNELMSRPGDQRRALLPLLNHSNAQVRLKSAISTLRWHLRQRGRRFRSSAIIKNIHRRPMLAE